MNTPKDVAVDYPLARLTTIRAGGRGDYFARPHTPAALTELLAWAASEGVQVGVVGCGGGARLPQAAAFAARAGLSGLEFGVNIPGTVGGAVKMNANAYGGDLARVLEWVDVTTASGTDRRAPGDLGFRYRRSNLAPGEIVARASFALSRSEPGSVKETLADMRSQRRAAQPSGIKTFGSTFKNPDDPRAEGKSAGVLLDEAGGRGLRVGGVRFSEKHANFVEN